MRGRFYNEPENEEEFDECSSEIDEATENQENSINLDENTEIFTENDEKNEEFGEKDVKEESSQAMPINEYLDMARRVQADFDNFRRHAAENVKRAKLEGQASVIEVFLPCLDTFKEAKKSITDEVVLKGVEMIENKINDALKELGVEKINSIGEVYNPHIHNVIAVMRDDEKENDIILDEYQAGYKFNDKVLRYAKVIVNKRED